MGIIDYWHYRHLFVHLSLKFVINMLMRRKVNVLNSRVHHESDITAHHGIIRGTQSDFMVSNILSAINHMLQDFMDRSYYYLVQV